MESRIQSGLVCTGDRFITNRMELDTIKQRFPGGLAVDMESACLKVTDVVASQRLVYHDVWCGDGNEYGQVQGFPASYEGCSSLLKHALSLNEAGMESRIHSGLVCTGDQFITNRTELDTIKQRFPDGLAVDMESAAIAQTCYLYNVPFLSFRIISDTPGVEDHASQYADFWGTMAERSFLTIWTFLSTLPSNL